MKKLLNEQRGVLLTRVDFMVAQSPDKDELVKQVNAAFNVLEDEADRFARALRHDATLIERAAAKLPRTAPLMESFAAALRDYAHRMEEGSGAVLARKQGEPGVNGRLIILPQDDKEGGVTG
jgi:hypothetical protein